MTPGFFSEAFFFNVQTLAPAKSNRHYAARDSRKVLDTYTEENDGKLTAEYGRPHDSQPVTFGSK